MGFATEHGYVEGQKLSCAVCAKQVQVKLFRAGEVAIITPGSLGDRACICDGCGRIFCHGCTGKLGLGVPKCDACGGPVTLPAEQPTGAHPGRNSATSIAAEQTRRAELPADNAETMAGPKAQVRGAGAKRIALFAGIVVMIAIVIEAYYFVPQFRAAIGSLAAGPQEEGQAAKTSLLNNEVENSGKLAGVATGAAKNPAQDGAISNPQNDLAAAVATIVAQAEKGDANAQYSLGMMYDEGKGVTKNVQEAMKWYQLAAAQGLAEAQFNLAATYKAGEGVAQNYEEAAKWFRLAAAQGYAKAQYSVGVMYDKGETVAQDRKEAAKWFRLAAEQGYAEAQFNLGVMHSKGDGVVKNEKEGVKWYLLAAAQRHASAAHNLAVAYHEGRGVARDEKEAVKWTRSAAGFGHSGAQYNIGVMHYLGQGVPKDYGEAFKWFRFSAQQGEAGSQYNLAVMYFKGMGVTEDHARAYTWFEMAAAQGHPGAAEGKANVEARMTIMNFAKLLEAQEMATRCKASNYRSCD